MVDKAVIEVKGGDGGNGSVHFLRTKFQPKGGPDGGDGGRGGSVYLVTEPNLNTLSNFRFQQRFEAEKGEYGRGSKCSGKAGEDLFVKVPLGTQVKNEATGEIIDLDQEDTQVLIAKGGKGGRGNWHFRSATNQVPREFEEGVPGEEKRLSLELKLLADIGLIGLPNSGKSTLLSVLTKATPKIANYPFTTLEPNLGVLYGKVDREEVTRVIADIPGLIEGASTGKGLGDDFLRHVERTALLVHVLSINSSRTQELGIDIEPEQLWQDYQTVRNELGAYNSKLLEKPEIVVLGKIDITPKELQDKIIEYFEHKNTKVLLISSAARKGTEELKAVLLRRTQQ